MKIPLVMDQSKVKPKECGSCTACCTSLEVGELAKPSCVKCEHESSLGCGIHDTKPESCKKYSCLWLEGILEGDERRRPDKLGLILEFRITGGGTSGLMAGIPMISIWELWEGASSTPNNQYLLSGIAKQHILYIRKFDSKSKRVFMGPSALLSKLGILPQQKNS